jgi:hypothetical protein
MRWIKLNLDNTKGNFEEFTNSIIYPISSVEYLLFCDTNVLDFVESFSVFVPLGYKMAHVGTSNNLRNLYDALPFRCISVNDCILLHISTNPEPNAKSETIIEVPENLKQFIDNDGNINPLLIFIDYSKEKVEFFKNIAQNGFPYSRVKDLNWNIGQFKKEVKHLINEYPRFFEILTRLPGAKDNFPKFVSDFMHKSKPESEVKAESNLHAKINAVDLIVRYPNKNIYDELVNKLNTIKPIPFEDNGEISLRTELLNPGTTHNYINIKVSGEIQPDRFIAYLEDLNEILHTHLKNIIEDFEKNTKTSGDTTKVDIKESVTRSKSKSSIGIGGRTPSITVKRLNILLPRERYETLRTIIKSYKLEVKLGSLGRNPCFKGHFRYLPLDFEFLIGADLAASESSILDEAFVLTRIGTKLILDGNLYTGTELLIATQKAIEEDIDFIKNGKEPRYAELRAYIYKHSGSKGFKNSADLGNILLGTSPPLSSYNLDLCKRYYEINRKYLNYSKSNDFLSLKTYVKLRNQLINESNIKKIDRYKFMAITILRTMNINTNTIEDLRDLLFILG